MTDEIHCRFIANTLCGYGSNEMSIYFPSDFKIKMLDRAESIVTCDRCKSKLQTIIKELPWLFTKGPEIAGGE